MRLDALKSQENKNYKSPFKKKLEEKEKLIENIAQDLRTKTQELIKFESVNRQLVEKLKAYQVLFRMVGIAYNNCVVSKSR